MIFLLQMAGLRSVCLLFPVRWCCLPITLPSALLSVAQVILGTALCDYFLLDGPVALSTASRCSKHLLHLTWMTYQTEPHCQSRGFGHLCFLRQSCCMTRTSLGLVILLSQTSTCWDYIYVSPHPAHLFKVDLSFPLRAGHRLCSSPYFV